MDFKLTTMSDFTLIGFAKEFCSETAYEQIPKFWDEIYEKYEANVNAENHTPQEKAFAENGVGEFGVCIDDASGSCGKFTYMVAGKYVGGEVPKGMTLYEFPQGEWAIFDCFGIIPDDLQSLNTKIFTEWLPNNPDFEMRGRANVEWYDCANGSDCHSAIWIPIKRK